MKEHLKATVEAIEQAEERLRAALDASNTIEDLILIPLIRDLSYIRLHIEALHLRRVKRQTESPAPRCPPTP